MCFKYKYYSKAVLKYTDLILTKMQSFWMALTTKKLIW